MTVATDNEAFEAVWRVLQQTGHRGAEGARGGPGFAFQRTHQHQNAREIGLLSEHWGILKDKGFTWSNLTQFIANNECISIFNGGLLLSSASINNRTGARMLLGEVYITASQQEDKMSDADTDANTANLVAALTPIVSFYYATNDPSANKRCDIWKAAAWATILKDLNNQWDVICLMACDDVSPEVSGWLAQHCKHITVISGTTFEDGGESFAAIMEDNNNCTVKNLLIDTPSISWEYMEPAITKSTTLEYLFYRSDVGECMSSCINAVASTSRVNPKSKIQEIHLHGKDCLVGEQWIKHFEALIRTKHLQIIRYELDTTDNITDDQKTDFTARIKAALSDNSNVTELVFGRKHIESSAWEDVINKMLKANKFLQLLRYCTNWVSGNEQKLWILNCMMRQERIRTNPTYIYSMLVETGDLFPRLRK
mmetsp:Transcript_20926/g.58194  ORF Transcript_20926/g.58194 Transcript_20926/m.58194 type:complete len:426 (-) Transcript_20926:195-1472(-)|eukprot:CAMPEP_0198113882 /NCGR_PEP_ID=MMETSP1442-20131203/5434_1 /TAXON_ID= /ORGANISM="Craspedostauros australis, Strain CCMP3328" /LENGTH=425 /DNA_ID=CAMNT_0043771081 /DNA_START=250 /DNA_END=1527 /DNA_ORIENTATION=-